MTAEKKALDWSGVSLVHSSGAAPLLQASFLPQIPEAQEASLLPAQHFGNLL